jgi:hypothetical protein
MTIIKWTYIYLVLAMSLATGTVLAAPMKCTSGGRTIYTDNIMLCDNASAKKVEGTGYSVNPPKTQPDTSARPATAAGKDAEPAQSAFASKSAGNPPAANPFGNTPLPQGVSGQDVASGWKTLMDAKKRGSWEAPALPEYAK